MSTDGSEVITALGLTTHPEGGAFKELYRSELGVSVHWSEDLRSASTCILFMLRTGEMSRLHKICSDEIWAYHLGGPMEVVEINPATGEVTKTVVGPSLGEHKLIHVVKAGMWFGSRPASSQWSLCSCFVSPGFDWRDFQMPSRAELLATLPPSARATVMELTPAE